MRAHKHKKKAAGGAQPFRLPTLVCRRCGHEWHPKTNRRPVRCAKCKSPYWEREREMKAEESAAENEGMAILDSIESIGEQVKMGQEHIKKIEEAS